MHFFTKINDNCLYKKECGWVGGQVEEDTLLKTQIFEWFVVYLERFEV